LQFVVDASAGRGVVCWVDGRKQWFLNGSEYPEDHWKIEVEKHKKGRLLLK
jgi:hypothetical protein